MNTATRAERWLMALADGPKGQIGEGAEPSIDGARQCVAAAELQVRRAWRRLQMVRSAAFNDEDDPDACETAALLYRRALQDVQHAREACTAAPVARTAPTSRLRFARWLVQTGRLSEDISERGGAPDSGGTGHVRA